MRILFISIMLMFYFSVFGQKTNEILCDLDVELISECSIKDTTVWTFNSNFCKITQSLQISHNYEDTMCFNLEKPSNVAFLNFIFFQKLTVKEKNSGKMIPYIFEENILKIIYSQRDGILEIEYYYQPDYFYFGNGDMACIFCPYQQSWFSWYFSTPNLKINNMTVHIPEHLYFFSNLVREKDEQGKTYLSCDPLPDDGISFFWIEKRYYEQVATNIQENQYNLYLFKDITLTGDSSSCYAAMLPSERVDEAKINAYILGLKKDVRNIEKIFPQKVNVDIVDACLDLSQDENTIRWGSAFLVSENQMLIIMDTSFWNGHFYTHEMIHVYNDLLPSKNDSAYYFFHESMTEFLAIYCKYDQQKIRDSVYEAKILKYIHSKQDYSTIFEIDKNTTTLEYGGTYGIIYLKTPFIINYFAKKIGEEKFIEILILFYEQARNTGIVNFQELENAFKSNGISNENWSWFVKNL